MIDYKAVQLALNKAGATPPLVADGKWGPKSTAALTAFQRAHPPLVVDGALGPKSLAALGLAPVGAPTSAASAPPVSTTPAGNPRDVNAYAVAKRAAPTMPEAQLQYSLAVSRGEGGFGAGWSNPPRDPVALAFAQKNGLTGTEGAGSNNWGAEMGQGDAGSFRHVDFGWRNPDGTPWNGKGPKVWLPYIGTYKRHSTPEKGFLSVAKTILGGGKRGALGAKEIQDAIGRGDLKAAVYAQHANGYFELNPAEYLKAVERNYADLTSALGWRALLSGATAAGFGSVLAGVVISAAVGGAIWWWKHKGGPA
jgi:peptidoglycan hydrolase-like protein with peptidoglycan-binding domain